MRVNMKLFEHLYDEDKRFEMDCMLFRTLISSKSNSNKQGKELKDTDKRDSE